MNVHCVLYCWLIVKPGFGSNLGTQLVLPERIYRKIPVASPRLVQPRKVFWAGKQTGGLQPEFYCRQLVSE